MSLNEAMQPNTEAKHKITFIYFSREFDRMLEVIRIKNPELIMTLERNDENPDYVIATDKCFMNYKDNEALRNYLKNSDDRIFILFSIECLEPDLNVFDYASTWNRKHVFPGRIIYNVPYIYNIEDNAPYKNDLTRKQAEKILTDNKGFCNFIYSHSSPWRDKFFHMLSKYKRVDSLGWANNNTGIHPTRGVSNWYDVSVDLKSGYKFSIAMENASYSGYTTEKIVSSLLAHTVPIYWGDPDVTDFINPKAFINCSDYSSFEEVIEVVKEIDNDNDRWLDMVTQPWQTEEQIQKTIDCAREYQEFLENIFSQDIKKARRRPLGEMNLNYSNHFWYVEPKPSTLIKILFTKAFRRLKRDINRFMKH